MTACRVLCNGIPKHGTHALLKAVELLGVPIKYGSFPGAELVHMTHGEIPEGCKHVFVIRHPKDAFISWMRHYNLPLASGFVQSRLQNMQDPVGNYLDYCMPFLDWIEDEDTYVIQYERLISEHTEITALAEYLGVKDQPDLLKHLPGHTITWNPERSDHTTLDAWGADVEKVWKGIGGEYLMETLGYVG